MAPDPHPPELKDAAIALMRWYREAGIEAVMLDAPRDRFAETAAETARRGGGMPTENAAAARSAETARAPEMERPAPMPEPARTETGDGFAATRVTVPDDVAIADARERARSSRTLEELAAAFARFEGCNLRLTAKSLVFGNGAQDADLMLIGEAPGREEDIAGEPFVGKSGQLLDRMLKAIGVERSAVRVTNTVPWRPPGNRPPTPAETEMCLPFLARQIELVRPKIIVCLGSPAAKAVLKTDEGILRLRGRWQTYAFGIGPNEAIPALPMLHPAYLLRQPAQKKLAWRDLVALRQKLDDIG